MQLSEAIASVRSITLGFDVHREALRMVCDAAERSGVAQTSERLTSMLAEAVKAQADTITAMGDQLIELTRK